MCFPCNVHNNLSANIVLDWESGHSHFVSRQQASFLRRILYLQPRSPSPDATKIVKCLLRYIQGRRYYLFLCFS